MSFILIINLLVSFSIIFMKHPLSMGATLLLQTVLTALIIGTLNLTFWFSYILALIMIGGMLILFIYMTSIASNEKFKFSMLLMTIYMSIMSLSMITLLSDQYLWNLKMMNFEMNSFQSIMQFNLTLNKFTNFPNNLMMYLTIIYLFVTLIAVVKITKKNQGPLRHMN
uniref:NADH-ubiquinone oxidoreductase chain 6 n=1 Tax=Cleroidea sp. 4 KM-2017 TaxID=2219309 RepID=A0A346RHN1_9CUCU|nr:NADH dehydrogenase subunit 6 [Cleroidea sp. 4 KM-2017]